jgi:hypothetical protein
MLISLENIMHPPEVMRELYRHDVSGGNVTPTLRRCVDILLRHI